MTQMTERTKKVADFLKANEGTFTPTEIDQKTGVSFRGIAQIMKTLTKDMGMTEFEGRVKAKAPKRMKMVQVSQN